MLPPRNGAVWQILFLVTALCFITEASSEGRVVCYYTNWSVYRPGTAKFNPQNINPYLCTHLIYAFGGFTKDNTLKPFDKYQDIEQGGYSKFTGLKSYNKNLKTLLAIGGWNEGSSRFSPLVANPERRQQFIKNILKFLRQNHFDGLDLDWEYPAYRDGGKPRDRDNYAQFVQELRSEFDRESSKTGRPRLLLTMAVPAGIEYIEKGYDIKKLNKHLDWFNILSYDYHSAYEPSVNHHAPLYSLEEESEYNYDTELNIDYTVKFYLAAGADRDKLVLGIPTYGRSYTLVNEDLTDIGAPADSPGDQGDATREKGYLAYYEICQNIRDDPDWTVVQPNPNAMGPYAFKGVQWVGYDDEAIVRRKAEFVADNGLGGIMFWSIDNDDFRGTCTGKPYPLIEAAKEALLDRLGLGDNEVGRPIKTRKPASSSRARGPPGSTNRNKGISENDSENTVEKSESTRKISNKKRPETTTTTTKTSAAPSSSSLYIGAKTTTPEPPTTPDPGTDFKCEEEGFFPHPRDCKKYFWCLDSGPSNLGIVAHLFTCPAGLYFNTAADSCDFTRNVLCKKTAKATTTAKPTTTTSRTTIVQTTSPYRVTAATSRTSFLRKSTTTEASIEEEEYEDDDESFVGGNRAVESEEDPKVIKELIELIKKVGGIEELEKQLQLAEDGTMVVKNNKTLEASTTASSISKSLYAKVLSRQNSFNTLKNRFGISNSATTQKQHISNDDRDEVAGKSFKNTDSKYSSVVRNSRPGPQNAGIDKLPEFEGFLKEKPKYVTIQRTRPTLPFDGNDDIHEENDDEILPKHDESSFGFTTSTPGYVNIRRSKPTASATNNGNNYESAEEATVRATQKTSYQSINRFRGSSSDDEQTTVKGKNVSKYTQVDRTRKTGSFIRQQFADERDKIADDEEEIEHTVTVQSSSDSNLYTHPETQSIITTLPSRSYASIERKTTTTEAPTITTTEVPNTTVTNTELSVATTETQTESQSPSTKSEIITTQNSNPATTPIIPTSVDIDSSLQKHNEITFDNTKDTVPHPNLSLDTDNLNMTENNHQVEQHQEKEHAVVNSATVISNVDDQTVHSLDTLLLTNTDETLNQTDNQVKLTLNTQENTINKTSTNIELGTRTSNIYSDSVKSDEELTRVTTNINDKSQSSLVTEHSDISESSTADSTASQQSTSTTTPKTRTTEIKNIEGTVTRRTINSFTNRTRNRFTPTVTVTTSTVQTNNAENTNEFLGTVSSPRPFGFPRRRTRPTRPTQTPSTTSSPSELSNSQSNRFVGGSSNTATNSKVSSFKSSSSSSSSSSYNLIKTGKKLRDNSSQEINAARSLPVVVNSAEAAKINSLVENSNSSSSVVGSQENIEINSKNDSKVIVEAAVEEEIYKNEANINRIYLRKNTGRRTLGLTASITTTTTTIPPPRRLSSTRPTTFATFATVTPSSERKKTYSWRDVRVGNYRPWKSTTPGPFDYDIQYRYSEGRGSEDGKWDSSADNKLRNIQRVNNPISTTGTSLAENSEGSGTVGKLYRRRPTSNTRLASRQGTQVKASHTSSNNRISENTSDGNETRPIRINNNVTDLESNIQILLHNGEINDGVKPVNEQENGKRRKFNLSSTISKTEINNVFASDNKTVLTVTSQENSQRKNNEIENTVSNASNQNDPNSEPISKASSKNGLNTRVYGVYETKNPYAIINKTTTANILNVNNDNHITMQSDTNTKITLNPISYSLDSNGSTNGGIRSQVIRKPVSNPKASSVNNSTVTSYHNYNQNKTVDVKNYKGQTSNNESENGAHITFSKKPNVTLNILEIEKDLISNIDDMIISTEHPSESTKNEELSEAEVKRLEVLKQSDLKSKNSKSTLPPTLIHNDKRFFVQNKTSELGTHDDAATLTHSKKESENVTSNMSLSSGTNDIVTQEKRSKESLVNYQETSILETTSRKIKSNVPLYNRKNVEDEVTDSPIFFIGSFKIGTSVQDGQESKQFKSDKTVLADSISIPGKTEQAAVLEQQRGARKYHRRGRPSESTSGTSESTSVNIEEYHSILNTSKGRRPSSYTKMTPPEEIVDATSASTTAEEVTETIQRRRPLEAYQITTMTEDSASVGSRPFSRRRRPLEVYSNAVAKEVKEESSSDDQTFSQSQSDNLRQRKRPLEKYEHTPTLKTYSFEFSTVPEGYQPQPRRQRPLEPYEGQRTNNTASKTTEWKNTSTSLHGLVHETIQSIRPKVQSTLERSETESVTEKLTEREEGSDNENRVAKNLQSKKDIISERTNSQMLRSRVSIKKRIREGRVLDDERSTEDTISTTLPSTSAVEPIAVRSEKQLGHSRFQSNKSFVGGKNDIKSFTNLEMGPVTSHILAELLNVNNSSEDQTTIQSETETETYLITLPGEIDSSFNDFSTESIQEATTELISTDTTTLESETFAEDYVNTNRSLKSFPLRKPTLNREDTEDVGTSSRETYSGKNLSDVVSDVQKDTSKQKEDGVGAKRVLFSKRQRFGSSKIPSTSNTNESEHHKSESYPGAFKRRKYVATNRLSVNATNSDNSTETSTVEIDESISATTARSYVVLNRVQPTTSSNSDVILDEPTLAEEDSSNEEQTEGIAEDNTTSLSVDTEDFEENDSVITLETTTPTSDTDRSLRVTEVVQNTEDEEYATTNNLILEESLTTDASVTTSSTNPQLESANARRRRPALRIRTTEAVTETVSETRPTTKQPRLARPTFRHREVGIRTTTSATDVQEEEEETHSSSNSIQSSTRRTFNPRVGFRARPTATNDNAELENENSTEKVAPITRRPFTRRIGVRPQPITTKDSLETEDKSSGEIIQSSIRRTFKPSIGNRSHVASPASDLQEENEESTEAVKPITRRTFKPRIGVRNRPTTPKSDIEEENVESYESLELNTRRTFTSRIGIPRLNVPKVEDENINEGIQPATRKPFKPRFEIRTHPEIRVETDTLSEETDEINDETVDDDEQATPVSLLPSLFRRRPSYRPISVSTTSKPVDEALVKVEKVEETSDSEESELDLDEEEDNDHTDTSRLDSNNRFSLNSNRRFQNTRITPNRGGLRRTTSTTTTVTTQQIGDSIEEETSKPTVNNSNDGRRIRIFKHRPTRPTENILNVGSENSEKSLENTDEIKEKIEKTTERPKYVRKKIILRRPFSTTTETVAANVEPLTENNQTEESVTVSSTTPRRFRKIIRKLRPLKQISNKTEDMVTEKQLVEQNATTVQKLSVEAISEDSKIHVLRTNGTNGEETEINNITETSIANDDVVEANSDATVSSTTIRNRLFVTRKLYKPTRPSVSALSSTTGAAAVTPRTYVRKYSPKLNAQSGLNIPTQERTSLSNRNRLKNLFDRTRNEEIDQQEEENNEEYDDEEAEENEEEEEEAVRTVEQTPKRYGTINRPSALLKERIKPQNDAKRTDEFMTENGEYTDDDDDDQNEESDHDEDANNEKDTVRNPSLKPINRSALIRPGFRPSNRPRTVNNPALASRQNISSSYPVNQTSFRITTNRNFERKYNSSLSTENSTQENLLGDLNVDALNARNKKIFELNSKKHTITKPKTVVSSTQNANTEISADEENTLVHTEEHSSSTSSNVEEILKNSNNLQESALDHTLLAPTTPATTGTTTFGKMTTLTHIFAIDENEETATPTEETDQSEEKVGMVTSEKQEKLVELNRVVEIYSKEGKHRQSEDQDAQKIENTDLQLEQLPTVEHLGAISRKTLVKLVESGKSRSLKDSSGLLIEGRSTVADYTPTEPTKPSEFVRNSIPLSDNEASADEKQGRKLLLPDLIFSVETSTIALEGLFENERGSKTLDLDGPVYASSLGEVPTALPVIQPVTPLPEASTESLTTLSTSTKTVERRTTTKTVTTVGPSTTTTEESRPNEAESAELPRTEKPTNNYVRPLVPLLRPESNESSPLVISIANLDKVILSKVPKQSDSSVASSGNVVAIVEAPVTGTLDSFSSEAYSTVLPAEIGDSHSETSVNTQTSYSSETKIVRKKTGRKFKPKKKLEQEISTNTETETR